MPTRIAPSTRLAPGRKALVRAVHGVHCTGRYIHASVVGGGGSIAVLGLARQPHCLCQMDERHCCRRFGIVHKGVVAQRPQHPERSQGAG